jgi:urate oxidase
MAEWSVNVSLVSDVEDAFTKGDNRGIVATDTCKNTVYVVAKQCKERCSAEEYAIKLAQHFLENYSHVSGVTVAITEKPWVRATVEGQPHNHGYQLAVAKHTVEVSLSRDGPLKLVSGVADLTVAKTTQSGFSDCYQDQYTTLGAVSERMLATSIRSTWTYSRLPSDPTATFEGIKATLAETLYGPPDTGVFSPSVQATLFHMAKAVLAKYPEVASVHLNMPNIHFLPVKLPFVKFEDDVFVATDEPHGTIQATLRREEMPRSKY